MALSDVWARTLVYFGIAEEEDWDEDGYLTEDELADEFERENVRRFPARRSRRDYDDDWTDPEPEDAQRTSILRPRAETRRVRNLEPVRGPGTSRVHLILPRSFNDAQQLADRFKIGVPVILNLQSADAELSKRLIDFASGLTYALDGGMQRRRAVGRGPGADARARLLQPGIGEGPGRANQPRMGWSARFVLLADAISSVETFINVFVLLYVLVILVYIVTSWLRLPYSLALNRVQRFLYDVCEPYLRIFRRLLPSMGGIDLSPVLALLALGVINRFLIWLLDHFH